MVMEKENTKNGERPIRELDVEEIFHLSKIPKEKLMEAYLNNFKNLKDSTED